MGTAKKRTLPIATASSGGYWSVTRSGRGQRGAGRSAPYIDPELEEQRKQAVIKEIMSRKR